MSELTLTHFFTYYDVGSRHVLTAELRPVLTKFAFILFRREVPCFQQYISKYHLDLVQFTKILNIFLVISKPSGKLRRLAPSFGIILACLENTAKKIFF